MATVPQTREWLAEGLDCPVCAATLEQAVADVPGVSLVRANPATGRVRVTYLPEAFDQAALSRAARAAGHPLRTGEDRSAGRAWVYPVAGAVLLAAGVALEALGHHTPAVYLLAAVAGGLPLLPRAWSAARRRTVDMNVLMTTALAGAIGLRDAREAAVLAVLFAISQWLERRSLATTGRAVESLLELAPARARVERDGEVVELAVDAVPVGARIRLRPGDVVPLDGTVTTGASAVDEAAVTGESVPVAKRPGDPVYAGTTVIDGALTVAVTHAAADSTLARVVKLVEEAEARNAPTARLIDRFAAWYTPAIVALAALVVLVPVALGEPFGVWFYRALVLLVIGCPCALVIATPVAVQSGLTAAARQGILVRGGAPLEAAAGLAAVAFDKTGTLTTGRPRLARIACLDGTDEARALALAAGLEADSSHPLAEAIRAAAAERGIAPLPVTDHRVHPGTGVRGVHDGRDLWLGSPALLAEAGLSPDGAAACIDGFEAEGLTVVVLAADRPLAAFGLANEVRPEAPVAVAALRQAGVGELVMLTGDQPATARVVAAAAGLSDVRAGLRPEAKQAAIRELAERGPVAMVGDGINDAPALAAATVGIALGAAGSPIAMETASVALLGDDLRGVARLVHLARRVRRTMVANIAIAFLIRLVLVPLAVSGHASLWLAILGDMGGSLLVTANSLRLLRP